MCYSAGRNKWTRLRVVGHIAPRLRLYNHRKRRLIAIPKDSRAVVRQWDSPQGAQSAPVPDRPPIGESSRRESGRDSTIAHSSGSDVGRTSLGLRIRKPRADRVIRSFGSASGTMPPRSDPANAFPPRTEAARFRSEGWECVCFFCDSMPLRQMP